MTKRLIAFLTVAVIGSACNEDRQQAVTSPTPAPTADTPASPASTPSVPTGPSVVQGIVLDFQTAKPMPGAVVGFSTNSGSLPSGAETAVADANGRYTLTEPDGRGGQAGRHTFFVNGQNVGSGYPRSANYRADVAVDRGRCIARYGVVLDRTTYLPIVGATALSLSNLVRATTDRNGWYHIDWGCGVGFVGFNTTWHIMSHRDYNSAQFAGGRGISGVYREDVMLSPR